MKGKHNFWSQLLLSIIAMFALPVSQNIETQPAVASENVQSSQPIQQRIQSAIQLNQTQQFEPAQIATFPAEKFSQNRPLFFSQIHYFQAPIRAGPILFV